MARSFVRLSDMYVPNQFKALSTEVIQAFISKYSFATLIGQYRQRIIATHIPVIYQKEETGNGILYGHIARANEMRHCFDGNQEMLAIFTEPHTYISSSWYEQVNVPTWNYISVHVYGKATLLRDDDLLKVLKDLVDQNEKGNRAPFRIDHMPEKMLHNQMKGIVGFTMPVDEIEASFKLSQNRNDKDFRNIIAELEKRGDELSRVIAEEMRKLRAI